MYLRNWMRVFVSQCAFAKGMFTRNVLAVIRTVMWPVSKIGTVIV